jgi:hypothetical protein
VLSKIILGFNLFLLFGVTQNSTLRVELPTEAHVIISTCNSSKSESYDVRIRMISAFDVLHAQDIKFYLTAGACESRQLLFRNIQTFEIYIGEKQNIFHVYPVDTIFLLIQDQRTVLFKGRSSGFAEYEGMMPVFSVGTLNKYKEDLPRDLFQFEELRIKYTNLDTRLRNLNSIKRLDLLDSIANGNFFTFTESITPISSYYNFLHTFMFFSFERKFAVLRPNYLNQNFTKKASVREEIADSLFSTYRGPKSSAQFKDSVRCHYWLGPYVEAKNYLTGDNYNNYLFHSAMIDLLLGNQCTDSIFSFVKNEITEKILVERLTSAKENIMKRQEEMPKNPFKN